MTQFIENMINQFGYLAISLLIAIENIFPPIPSELILTFSGFLTTTSQLTVFGAVIAATIGAGIGAAVLYWVGSFLDMTRLAQLVDSRLGRLLRLRLKDFEQAEKFFLRHGRLAVFAGRFIPVVRSLISVPAGMTKMPFGIFMLYSVFGSGIWNLVLISLGHVAGQNWQQVLGLVDEYKYLFLIVLVILVLVIWLYKFCQTKKAKSI